MKVLLVACFALLSVASGFPTVSQWTLDELSQAIQDPNTHPLMMPYLESALNDMMTAIFHGYDQKIATIVVPADVAAVMNPIIVEPVVVEPVIVDGVVSQWTLHELSQAMQDPNTHPLMMPYLEDALNEMMSAIMNGEHKEYVTIVVPADVAAAMNPVIVEPVVVDPVIVDGVVSQWTLHELSQAIQDQNTHPLMMPYLEDALNEMMSAIMNGEHMEYVTIVVPADVAAAMNPVIVEPVVVDPVIVDGVVSHWTLHELSQAIQDPNTHPLMMPYLESALNEMMSAIMNGEEPKYATIVIPADVAAAMNPVIVDPVVVDPVMPVLPEDVAPVLPVEQPTSSPLVQIILNINTNQASVPVSPVVTLPEIVETPVAPVVTLPEIVETPVAPVVTLPEIVETPVAPVVTLPEVVDVNPIDNVAVEAMPVNPIDILAPIGVVAPSTGGILV